MQEKTHWKLLGVLKIKTNKSKTWAECEEKERERERERERETLKSQKSQCKSSNQELNHFTLKTSETHPLEPGI